MTSSAASETDSARNTHVRQLRADAAEHLDAAAAGQVHVEEDDLGLRSRAITGDGFGDRAGLADDVDLVGDRGELGAHPRAEQRVVVDEERP